MDGIRVARKRVLRLMREHALLSPHRARTRDTRPHDRRIITDAPNIMWATDATQITTVQDGKVWLFGVIEHWNAETLGWHVANAAIATPPSRPSAWRFAMSSATSAPAPPAASRCDTTTAARSSPNISTTRSASGMTPSYAFVGEPETNGVIERFFRTLKEQIVHGRIYQTIDRSVTPSATSSPAKTPSG